MFNRLRNKWKVSWLEFTLIFCTFAVGGSLTGFITRKIIVDWLNITQPLIKWPLYVVLATFLWMIIVVIVSIPFGQFRFFSTYVKKILGKFVK
jgi:hypothetical protein